LPEGAGFTHLAGGDAHDLPGPDLVGVGDLRVCPDQIIQRDSESAGNVEHGIARPNCIGERSRGTAPWWLRDNGYTDDLPWEDEIGIGDLRVGGNEGIERNTKPLGDEEHAVSGLYCIGEGPGRAAPIGSGHTDDLPWEDEIGIGDLRVGRNQGVEGHSKSLGNSEHGVAWLHRITKRVGRAGELWHADDLPWEDEVRIGNLGIGCDEGIQGYSKSLGYGEHGIAWLNSITESAWRAGRRLSRDAYNLSWADLAGIRNLGVSSNQSVEADSKLPGDGEHGIPRADDVGEGVGSADVCSFRIGLGFAWRLLGGEFFLVFQS